MQICKRPPRLVALFVSALVVSIPLPLLAQASPPVTIVKAARLLDPRSGNVLAPAVVEIKGEKIEQVGSPAQVTVPPGAKVVDLGSATLLPGFIDGHTHLLLDIVVPPKAES